MSSALCRSKPLRKKYTIGPRIITFKDAALLAYSWKLSAYSELFYLQWTILAIFTYSGKVLCLQWESCFFAYSWSLFCLQWESTSNKGLKGL